MFLVATFAGNHDGALSSGSPLQLALADNRYALRRAVRGFFRLGALLLRFSFTASSLFGLLALEVRRESRKRCFNARFMKCPHR